MNKIFIIIPIILISCISENTEVEKELLKKEVRKEILDSLKKSDSIKTIKHTFKLKKGKKVLVYDNNTWEYSTNKLVDKNNLKSKNLSLENSNANLVVNSLASNSSKPKKKKRKNKSNISNSYSSGTCGYPTKSGGRCRRTVKGGGTCWQHG